MLNKRILDWFSLALMISVGGCGNIGPLYLPPKSQASAPAKPSGGKMLAESAVYKAESTASGNESASR